MENIRHTKRVRRHKKIRSRVSGTGKVPRLSVFKSNRHIYAQLIDDEKGRTLASATDKNVKESEKKPMKERASVIGAQIAKQAKTKKITEVVFDRGGFSYKGNIHELASAARKEGLSF